MVVKRSYSAFKLIGLCTLFILAIGSFFLTNKSIEKPSNKEFHKQFQTMYLKIKREKVSNIQSEMLSELRAFMLLNNKYNEYYYVYANLSTNIESNEKSNNFLSIPKNSFSEK